MKWTDGYMGFGGTGAHLIKSQQSNAVILIQSSPKVNGGLFSEILLPLSNIALFKSFLIVISYVFTYSCQRLNLWFHQAFWFRQSGPVHGLKLI